MATDGSLERANSGMHRVDFIRTEQGDDLIVSFAVAASGYPADILSLTLLRTPRYEFMFEPDERGVSVSWEKDEDGDEDEDEDELLLGVECSGDVVKLNTTTREFLLDVSCVGDDDLAKMCRVLHKMNFDLAVSLVGIRHD